MAKQKPVRTPQSHRLAEEAVQRTILKLGWTLVSHEIPQDKITTLEEGKIIVVTAYLYIPGEQPDPFVSKNIPVVLRKLSSKHNPGLKWQAQTVEVDQILHDAVDPIYIVCDGHELWHVIAFRDKWESDNQAMVVRAALPLEPDSLPWFTITTRPRETRQTAIQMAFGWADDHRVIYTECLEHNWLALVEACEQAQRLWQETYGEEAIS